MDHALRPYEEVYRLVHVLGCSLALYVASPIAQAPAADESESSKTANTEKQLKPVPKPDEVSVCACARGTLTRGSSEALTCPCARAQAELKEKIDECNEKVSALQVRSPLRPLRWP